MYGGTANNEDGSIKYEQNVFCVPPAFIVENAETASFHQGKEYPICEFDAFMIGDYFWITIPDVVQGKWNVKMIYITGSRANLMMIYNDDIISNNLIMDTRDKAWSTWTTMSEKKMGEIEVTERGAVTLYFQVIGLKRSPSGCCDMLMDMIELSPVLE